MAPWKKFVEGMKASYLEADRLREKALTREVWSRWQRIVEEKERERTAIATAHHHRALLKKGLMAWVKVRAIIYSTVAPDKCLVMDENLMLVVRNGTYQLRIWALFTIFEFRTVLFTYSHCY